MKLTIHSTHSGGGRLTDEITHTIPCPQCSHEITESLDRLKNDPILVCSACGQRFAIESGGTARDTADKVAELDRAWNNLIKG
jgi:transcription elongation factor Elf1